MVHAADVYTRIVDTTGYARTKNRRQHFIIPIRKIAITGKNFYNIHAYLRMKILPRRRREILVNLQPVGRPSLARLIGFAWLHFNGSCDK
jgi:hypothetical protein